MNQIHAEAPMMPPDGIVHHCRRFMPCGPSMPRRALAASATRRRRSASPNPPSATGEEARGLSGGRALRADRQCGRADGRRAALFRADRSGLCPHPQATEDIRGALDRARVVAHAAGHAGDVLADPEAASPRSAAPRDQPAADHDGAPQRSPARADHHGDPLRARAVARHDAPSISSTSRLFRCARPASSRPSLRTGRARRCASFA